MARRKQPAAPPSLNLAIARAVKKARADERAKLAGQIHLEEPDTRPRQESVVLYRNGGTEFTMVTPLRFPDARDAVDFASVLGGMFPQYEFLVAPALKH